MKLAEQQTDGKLIGWVEREITWIKRGIKLCSQRSGDDARRGRTRNDGVIALVTKKEKKKKREKKINKVWLPFSVTSFLIWSLSCCFCCYCCCYYQTCESSDTIFLSSTQSRNWSNTALNHQSASRPSSNHSINQFSLHSSNHPTSEPSIYQPPSQPVT